MHTRIAAYAFTALLALSGTLWVFGVHKDLKASQERVQALTGALQAAQEARAASEASTAKWVLKNQALQKRQKETDARLSEALRENPVWADAMVPSSVAGALGL